MATPYEKIYESLLPKFRSYEIPFMSVDEVKEYLHDFLIPAIAKFQHCKQDLDDRDDILERFNVDLSNNEIEILSNYLLLEYLDSEYVRTPTLLKLALPSTDFKAFSPANMLEKLMNMHKQYLAENETLIARYAWLGAKNLGASLGVGYRKSKI